MARLFTAGGTDRLSWGSDAKLDNLAQGSFTPWAVVRRSSAAANLFVAAKAAAGGIVTQGWQFLLDQYPSGGAAPGHMRLLLGRTAYTDIFSGNASGVDVVPADTHYFIAVVWNGSAATFYLSPFKTPVVAATTAPTINNAGSGSFGADAAADLWVGNSVASGGSVEFGGDIDWCGVHTGALSRAQLRQIQQGCLAYNAGDTTRGAAMINGVAGCVLAGKLSSGGTATDVSASPATGTFTGTDAGTAFGDGDEITIVDDEFGDCLYKNVTGTDYDQVTHKQASGYGRTGLVTTVASAGELWMMRTGRVDEADQFVVGMKVNGAYADTLVPALIGELCSDTFSGLGGANKTLEFICAPRSRPGGLPAEGAWPTLLITDQAASIAAPVEGTNRLHYMAESTLEGFFCDPPGQYAPAIEFRDNLPNGFDGIASYAYGGMNVADVAGDATLRTETAAVLTAGNPKAIAIAIGVNDKAGNVALATFSSQLTALVQEIIDTVAFTGKVYLLGPLITVNYETANANGDTLDDFRDEINAIATGFASSRVIGQSMKAWVTTGQLDADGTHLTNVSGPIVGQELADRVAVTATDQAAGGTVTPAGALSKQVLKSAGGSIAPSAALTRAAAKRFGGSTSPAGVLQRQIFTVQSGTLSSAGTLFKASARSVEGTVSPAGTVSALRGYLRAVDGSVSASGALAPLAILARAFAGALSLTGALVKRPEKQTTGTVAPSGAVTRVVWKRIDGTLVVAGTVRRDVQKQFTATIPLTGVTVTVAGTFAEPGPHPLTISFERHGKRLVFVTHQKTIDFEP